MNEDFVPYEDEPTRVTIAGFEPSKLGIILIAGVSAIMLIYFVRKK